MPAARAAAKIGGFRRGSQALRIVSTRSATASAAIASASEASSCAEVTRSSPVPRGGARGAVAVDVGEHEMLEEAAVTGDGGGRGTHAARSDDEDAHARERTAR